MRCTTRWVLSAALIAAAWATLPFGNPEAEADYGWYGQRRVSYQRQNDLFYNHYVGPGPNGVPAEMYVSPLPVPEHVGHTYTTYQPFMPHEYMYGHKRSYYTYNGGAGWTRTTVRYNTCGNWLKWADWRLNADNAKYRH